MHCAYTLRTASIAAILFAICFFFEDTSIYGYIYTTGYGCPIGMRNYVLSHGSVNTGCRSARDRLKLEHTEYYYLI